MRRTCSGSPASSSPPTASIAPRRPSTWASSSPTASAPSSPATPNRAGRRDDEGRVDGVDAAFVRGEVLRLGGSLSGRSLGRSLLGGGLLGDHRSERQLSAVV